MYLLYESYNDECRVIKEERTNTKILGLYEDKDKALEMLENVVEETITSFEDKNGNWFSKKMSKDLIENENIIKVYQIFNEEMENIWEMFYIIVEKIEVEYDTY